MTNTEFSVEFDILYNNIMSDSAPELSDYEKSVFLTQAQEAIIIALYNGSYNGDSFESTEEVSKYLDAYKKQCVMSTPVEGDTLSSKSKLFELPEDVWFITLELANIDYPSIDNKTSVPVVPVTEDEYSFIVRDPFKRDNKNKVLRLSYGNYSELISSYNISEYIIRYLSKPSPIILKSLHDEGVTIEGETIAKECKLNSAIHRIILNKAVLLAKLVWEAGKNTNNNN